MKRTNRWLTCSAALALTLFGAVRADAATVSVDLNPDPGDQGVAFAEAPPGAPVTIQVFAQNAQNVTGFTVDVQLDPGAVEAAPPSIAFSPSPPFPVTFPVRVVRTVATGMGGQLPPQPVSDPHLLLGTFTFKTLPAFERTVLKIVKVELKHGSSPAEVLTPNIELKIARPGAAKMGGPGGPGGPGMGGPGGPGQGQGQGQGQPMMGGPGQGQGQGQGQPMMGGPGQGQGQGQGQPMMGGPGMGGPGPMGTPSAEEMRKMFERWKGSPEAKDLNGDGKTDEADFKVFMEKMKGMGGPGGPGMGQGQPMMGGQGQGQGQGQPMMGGQGQGQMGGGMGQGQMGGGQGQGQPMMGGSGMGGPGGPVMGGPIVVHGPPGGPGGPGMGGPDPGMVFEMIKQMYPNPDIMPAGLGDAFKKAEAAHKDAAKAGLTFLKGFLENLKKEAANLGDDPKAQQTKNLAMQVEQAIKMIEMHLKMMENPPMGPPMGGPMGPPPGGQGTPPPGGNK